MLNRIIDFSLKHRLFILIAAVLLMVIGLFTLREMEVDVFPDLNAPTVVVMTEAKGMAPEEVERMVTFPIETAVNGAPDVRRVRSSSAMGLSIVWVEFEWGTEIYRARQIVSEKLTAIGSDLPANVGSPTLAPQSSILGEVMIISLTSTSTSQQELRTLAEWDIRPRLLATGGVAQVTLIGGKIKEYQILLNTDRMRYYGATLANVREAVAQMNENAAGGAFYQYGNEYILRGMLATDKIEELSKAPVRTESGAPLLLGKIAEIKVGNREPEIGTAAYRGQPAVLITVTKQPNTGTVELTKRIDAALSSIKKSLPADVKISTDTYRQTRFISSSIENIRKSLYEGAFFVIIVLFLFLMNARATLISLISIPLSLLASIVALRWMGLTINTMSLGGMAIAIGSLVDDAIVDVENVFRRLRLNRALPEAERLPSLKVVFEASKEVRIPVLNSTLIIIVSFLPLFFLSGMEGRMLVPLGIAFIVALFASTIVALTLTPVLCSYLLTSKNKGEMREPRLIVALKKSYSRCLSAVLRYPKVTLGVAFGLFIAALLMFFQMGRSFLPPFNEGSFTINVAALPGTSLEESDRIGQKVDRMLLEIPEIKSVGRKTGRAELDEHSLGVNVSEIEAPFELNGRSKEEVTEEIRRKLKRLPGINCEIGGPITHRIDAMLSGTQANIAIKIFGDNLKKLYQIGNEVRETAEGVEGLVDVNVEQQIESPQLKIIPRREALAKYGITLPEFSQWVTTLLGGENVSMVYEGDKVFDLVLKVSSESRKSIGDLKNISIDIKGNRVPVRQIAEVKSDMGPNKINRENVQRRIVVSANVEGRDLISAVKDIRKRLETAISLPEGYHIEYGGQFESEESARTILTGTAALSVLVIFLLLYLQFRNARQSAIILINLPLALIGGIMALWVTGSEVSIPAIIGFISLFGIATRNGMLMIARYNDLGEKGMALKERVMKGSADRINPILMTALTSGMALIPLALGGALLGNEIQSPMGKVILGGLGSSTLLNLFVTPVIYIISEQRKEKIA